MVKVNHLLLTINSAANIIIYSIKVSIYSWWRWTISSSPSTPPPTSSSIPSRWAFTHCEGEPSPPHHQLCANIIIYSIKVSIYSWWR
jgi:hypothetical protein